jgi:hypothetical protein
LKVLKPLLSIEKEREKRGEKEVREGKRVGGKIQVYLDNFREMIKNTIF